MEIKATGSLPGNTQAAIFFFTFEGKPHRTVPPVHALTRQPHVLVIPPAHARSRLIRLCCVLLVGNRSRTLAWLLTRQWSCTCVADAHALPLCREWRCMCACV